MVPTMVAEKAAVSAAETADWTDSQRADLSAAQWAAEWVGEKDDRKVGKSAAWMGTLSAGLRAAVLAVLTVGWTDCLRAVTWADSKVRSMVDL